ncbi:MAG: amino acid--tRNA ligase-related protein [Thermomicrobiales bacterium]
MARRSKSSRLSMSNCHSSCSAPRFPPNCRRSSTTRSGTATRSGEATFSWPRRSFAAFGPVSKKCGSLEIFSPKLAGSATESGSNVFEMEYFGCLAYLAQSPQFYKQMMVGVFERVFEVGPGVQGGTARHDPPSQ